VASLKLMLAKFASLDSLLMPIVCCEHVNIGLTFSIKVVEQLDLAVGGISP
jgi:hypothetical protein